MAIRGVSATRETTPNASVMIFPPRALQAPALRGSRKVLVIGPLATPPESKAIPTKILGTKRDNTKAITYPGIRMYKIGICSNILSIANATLTETPIDIQRFIAWAEIAPFVTVST